MAISIESALARENIREALGRYSMLLDGDGIGREPQAWANNLFTSDATFVLHYPDGTEQYRIEGREAIGKTFGRPWILESGDATLHGEHRLRRANSDEREDADFSAHPGIEARPGMRQQGRCAKRRPARSIRDHRVSRHMGARRRRMEEEAEYPAAGHLMREAIIQFTPMP